MFIIFSFVTSLFLYGIDRAAYLGKATTTTRIVLLRPTCVRGVVCLPASSYNSRRSSAIHSWQCMWCFAFIWVRLQPPQERCYPVLAVYAVFCVSWGVQKFLACKAQFFFLNCDPCILSAVSTLSVIKIEFGHLQSRQQIQWHWWQHQCIMMSSDDDGSASRYCQSENFLSLFLLDTEESDFSGVFFSQGRLGYYNHI